MPKSRTANQNIPQGTLEESKHAAVPANAENTRLNECKESAVPWKKWGPYLSERGNGGLCAKITAPTATRGIISFGT
jgi:hypothetical protein